MPFIVNLRRNYSKIRNINIILCLKRGLSILSKSSKYLEVELKASKSKGEFQYQMNLPYLNEVQKHISDQLFVQNKDYQY